MDVHPVPGLEHLPFAEVWLHAVDEAAWTAASDLARALGKTGLEVWTTTRSPEVAPWLETRAYLEARRYVISEVEVAAAADLGPPRFEIVSVRDRPDLVDELYALARVAYPDQPGRAETRVDEAWYEWGLRAHPADAYLVALERGRVLGYGYLEQADGVWSNGFMAVARDARGRGVAGAIKRAQLDWAREHGVLTLRTANETRLQTMLDLNRRLGYVPLYEEVVLRGPLAAAQD